MELVFDRTKTDVLLGTEKGSYSAADLNRVESAVLELAELAKKLGVTRNTYAGYESGKRLPPAWFVCCTADYFKVAVDELIGQEIKKEKKHKNYLLKMLIDVNQLEELTLA